MKTSKKLFPISPVLAVLLAPFSNNTRHHRGNFLAVALIFAIVLFVFGSQRAYAATIIYVTPIGGGDGSSWANATTLQNALSTAVGDDEIWVKSGLYLPGATTDDIFRLPHGVRVYGGFAGTENDRSQRDWQTNVTVLSGDIDNNDLNKDANGVVSDTSNITGTNSAPVVVAGDIGATPFYAVLDGFTITAGNASGGAAGGFYCGGKDGGECSPHLENIIFSGNAALQGGGAMYNDGFFGKSNPTLLNVTFINNTVSGENSFGGGAMANNGQGGISSPRLENVTFTNNSAPRGGAIFNLVGHSGESSPTLINVTFTNNSAIGDDAVGGAIFNNANFDGGGISSPTLEDVTFTGNSASQGGAMFSKGGVDGGESSPILRDVTFTNNSAIGDNAIGGAMLNWANGGISNPMLENVTFTGNSSAGTGGAMYNSVDEEGESSPVLFNVTFTGNSAEVGGAMYNSAINSDSEPVLQNVTFTGNSATLYGGAIFNRSEFIGRTTPMLENVTFTNNTAAEWGGAMYNFSVNSGIVNPSVTNAIFIGNSAKLGGAVYNRARDGGTTEPGFVNISFTGNSASEGGGVMYNIVVNSGTSNPNLVNSILWDNSAPDGAQIHNLDATAQIQTSLVQGGVNGTGVVNEGSSSVTDGGGNVDADPLFIDAGTGNLRLQSNSPAIDTGNNGANLIYGDLDGNPRITDGNGDGVGTVDMGAYEGQFYQVLTVTKAGNGNGQIGRAPTGTACPSACTASYATGTAVTLSATPATGSTFAGWGGECTGTGQCSVTLNSAKQVTATFTLNSYTLNVNSGSGGTVSKQPDQASYLYGTVVTLTAHANTGFSLSAWSGACTGTGTCVVTIDGDKSVSAAFSQNSYALTTNTIGSGTVSKQPNQATYLHGTVVNVTATADDGFAFSGWSGACTGTVACSVTMDSAKSVTATFTQNQLNSFALTVNVVGGGSVSKQPNQATYPQGTVVTLTATANTGFTFTGWSGACSGTGICSVAMDSDKSVTATFTQISTPGNDAPAFTSTPGLSATVGAAYSYSIVATDPDTGDIFTITAPTKPAWLTLTPTGSGTATLAGTPSSANVGDNVVQLRVEDAAGAFTTQEFTIAVAAANPAITGNIQGTVLDAAGNPVKGAVVTLADGNGEVVVALVVTQLTDDNGDYRFEGVPLGSYTITVSVDGMAPSAPSAVTVQAGQTATIPDIALQPSKAALHLPMITR